MYFLHGVLQNIFSIPDFDLGLSLKKKTVEENPSGNLIAILRLREMTVPLSGSAVPD